MKKWILLGFASLWLNAFSQPKKVVADKIVAQVGDKIILHSDIHNAIADYKRQGQDAQLPPNAECAFLEGQLIQKTLILQARKDSIEVSEEEIESILDNKIRYFIQMYGSKEMLEEISGRTVYQLKDDFRSVFKEQKLAENMRGKIVENVKITPAEVKVFFDKIPQDSLPFYEAEFEIKQVVLIPKANKDVDEYTVEQLNDYKSQVENGTKKFEVLARQLSEDPGSKENGGMYNISRNEKFWDPAFLSATFRLKEGQISPVVKSKFGYHIIQMVSRSGDDAVIRHILRVPPITEAELNESKHKLDSVRNLLLNNQITIGEAINKFSNDDAAKFNAGSITSPTTGSNFVTIDELDKDIVATITHLSPGQVTQPLVYDERGAKRVRLVYLKSQTNPHRENLTTDYNKIAQKALEAKKQATLEKWFATNIPTFYLNIDPSFTNCPQLNNWWKAVSSQKK